ncbi:hypothetical protein EB061_03705 [bacterium]|nr:hypothetical protein [bacterium]
MTADPEIINDPVLLPLTEDETSILQVIRIALRRRLGKESPDPFSNTGARVDFQSFSVHSNPWSANLNWNFFHRRTGWQAYWGLHLWQAGKCNWHPTDEELLIILSQCMDALDSEMVLIT